MPNRARAESTPRRLLSLADAAALMAVSRWTVRRLIDIGALPTVRLPAADGRARRRILLDAADIQALIDRCKECEL